MANKGHSAFRASQAHKAKAAGIHIKPANRGLFTKKANAAGKSVQEYGREKYSAPGVLGAEARFAVSSKKFNH